MPRSTLTPEERRIISHGEICDHRRTRIAELYVKGRSAKLIAADLGCTADTVKKDLEIIFDEWRATRMAYAAQAAIEQLEKFDRIEWEANQAWEKSKQPSRVTTITEDEHGNTVTKIERRESAGDGSFLALVAKAIEQRQKLLGLNAPVKTESQVNATVLHYQPPPSRQEVAEKVAELVQRIRQPSSN